MKANHEKQINTQRFRTPEFLTDHLDSFSEALAKKGFTPLTIGGYAGSVAHFGGWLQKRGKLISDIDLNCINEFAKHHCNCQSGRRKSTVSRKYAKRVLKFVMYLHEQGIIEVKTNINEPIPLLLTQFAMFLEERGLRPVTVKQYQNSMLFLMPKLGTSTEKYDIALIQQVICDVTQPLSRPAAKHLVVALRAYLRFLSLNGLCLPDLDKTVPTIAQWSLSSIPKYISANEVESVINACEINTDKGLRDRAIILLLARLGLRAGDIVDMKIGDISWSKGTLTVSGKGQKESRLPLPQEVGDAILAYLHQVRPHIAINSLFLCLNAPFRALGNASCVSNIVGAALKRTNIKNLPSYGAHLLRHSAATSLLREGVTLEAVSTLLRHSSIDMTMYYAKVDIPNLLKIAQPWPEKRAC
jgi:site-specific recombinase XerD